MAGKAQTKFIIDSLMVLVGSLLAGIGFLMKFVLVPGKERFAVYGQNVDLFFLGFDRHEWGTLHLWLAFVLIALLAVHIVLHLGWILNMARTMITDRRAQITAVIFLVLCILFLLFAFVIQPDVRDGTGGEGHGFGKGRMEHRLRN